MKDDFDIEDALRRYRIDPSSRVKRSVLSRFTDTFGARSVAGRPIAFWKRPVPVYLVTAIIIIAAGLSFFAGQKMPQREKEPSVLHERLQETEMTKTQELKWEVAHNDLL